MSALPVALPAMHAAQRHATPFASAGRSSSRLAGTVTRVHQQGSARAAALVDAVAIAQPLGPPQRGQRDGSIGERVIASCFGVRGRAPNGIGVPSPTPGASWSAASTRAR